MLLDLRFHRTDLSIVFHKVCPLWRRVGLEVTITEGYTSEGDCVC
jgi:hypothetical protein